jgi:hypothetical protein
MMRRFLTIWCVVSGLSITAMAQDGPTTRPGLRPPFGDGRRMMLPEERAQFESFAQEHMPNLYKLANQSPLWSRMRLMRYASARMLTYNQAINDQALADKVAQDIESEDEVFAIVILMENSPPADRPALQQKLTDKMRQVIDNLLDERKARLDRLRQKLDDEEKRLKEDRANRDDIVEERVERLLDDMPSHDAQSSEDGHPRPTTEPTTAPAK